MLVSSTILVFFFSLQIAMIIAALVLVHMDLVKTPGVVILVLATPDI